MVTGSKFAIPYARRAVERMGRFCLIWCCTGIVCAAVLHTGTVPSGKVDFLRDVRPILASHCLKCHGPDDEARKARLRLDVRELAVKPAKSGELPIVPGRPEMSELVRRIFAEDEDDRMPPPAAKNPLTADQKAMLRQWVSEGAPYQPHWAWVKPVQVSLPEVHQTNWPRNAVDSFVLARLEKEGLTPSPIADRYTLVRRVYLDLIGLLPTPEQAEAFVNDASPVAYDHLVDTLLASPHYGERWARRWLDLARYADTNGYEKDRPRSIWPWRDWVINALNADLPFDEFTVKQLAGDMLPHATEADLIATGFNRNSMLNEEGGIDPLEFRFYSMVDRVHVTATTWLGLTLQCAQCHTHKFDPIQHQEYYQFMAFLDNCDEPSLPIPDPAIAAKRCAAQAKIDELQAALVDHLPVESKIEWLTPADVEFYSEKGSDAERLPDGSLRVGGKNPEKDNYTVEFSTSFPRITHLQIEVFPDETGAKDETKRSDRGRFILSEVQMRVQTGGGEAEPQDVTFSAAKADDEQESYPAANAIDGTAETGWATGTGTGRRFHRQAIFTLAQPLSVEDGARVTVRLLQQAGGHQTLGRFRISLGNELIDLRPLAERRRANRDRLLAKWLETEQMKVTPWKPLHLVAATRTRSVPRCGERWFCVCLR